MNDPNFREANPQTADRVDGAFVRISVKDFLKQSLGGIVAGLIMVCCSWPQGHANFGLSNLVRVGFGILLIIGSMIATVVILVTRNRQRAGLVIGADRLQMVDEN